MAYLENAFKISYEQQFNSIWTAAFSLPLNDSKDEEINAFDFLELFNNEKLIGMFRILPKETVKNENTKTITYKCEHVLATLLSDVLFRYHQLSNFTTKDVIEYLLNQQETKHWKLGKCDFIRYFHYSWEHENTILGPLSTASGGNSTQTSSSGGGTTKSTTTATFSQLSLMSGVPQNSVGTENWGYHLHETVIPGSHFSHGHNVTIPSHTHSVNIPKHAHEINIPDHTHQINIPNYTHSITLPDHTHDIQHGIYMLSEKSRRVTVKVDGNVVPVDSTSTQNINLIPYLSKDGGGKIERNKWHEVTIKPDKLGRVNANIISRLCIQSRIGGTF